MKKRENAIAFVRVANKNIEKPSESFVAQLKLIQDYAKRNNIEIKSVSKSVGSDKAISEKLIWALKECNSGEIDYLLVSRPDRLARDIERFYFWKTAFDVKNVKIRFVTPGIENPESPMGAFMEIFAICLAENTHRVHSENIKRAIRNKKALVKG